MHCYNDKGARWLVLAFLAVLASCGGGSGGGSGQIRLEIENKYQPAGIELPNAEETEKAAAPEGDGSDLLRVVRFRLTVSGEDMEPMVMEEQVGATQLMMLGIPPGKRDVLIEAFNANDELIRRRLIEGVTITAGVVTPVKTALNTIPIILNYREKAVALTDYFRIKGFGEPKSPLAVESVADGINLDLCLDIAGNPLSISPSADNGLFEFSPGVHAQGRQQLTLRDLANGESSSRSVTVVDAENRPGFRFVSAGALGGANAGAATFGTGVAAAPHQHFPAVLHALSGAGTQGGGE